MQFRHEARVDSVGGVLHGRSTHRVGIATATPGERPPRGAPRRWTGRIRAVVAIGIVALVAGATFAACSSGGSTSAPESVSLARLAEQQEDFAGQRVTTTGVVRRFGHGAGVHFVVEDAAHHRVEVTPASLVEGRVGREVTVTGVFHFDETTGRSIEAESVRPAT